MDEMIKDFVTEVTDLLHEMENDLILLEKDPGNTDIVNKKPRGNSVHSRRYSNFRQDIS